MRDKPQPIRRSAADQPDPVIRYRLSTDDPPRTLAISATVEDITGFPAAELFIDPALWLDRVVPAHRPAVAAAWRDASPDRETCIEYQLLGVDGQIRVFRDRFMQVQGPDGVTELVGERRHLTQTTAAAKALGAFDVPAQPANSFQHLLFDSLPIGLALTRMNGELVQVNQAYADIIGRSIEETLGLTYWDITPDRYSDEEAAQLDSLQRSGSYGPYEKHYIHKRGHLVPVRLSGLLVEHDGETFIWSSVENIADLKTAEAELRRSESELREIIDNLPDTFYRTDAEGRVVLVSRRVEELLGWRVEEMIGRPLADLYVEPDGRTRFLQILADNGGTLSSFEVEVRRKDGARIWVATNSHYWCDSSGTILGVEGAVRDITASKRAQDMLAQAAVVFETAAEAALITDHENRIVAVNPAFTEITGYTESEVLGKAPVFLRSGRHPESFFVQQGETVRKHGRWQGDIWHRCRDGKVIPTWQTTSTVRGDQGELIYHVSLFADITPIKDTQQQLDHLAHHDALTGLPNRLMFNDRLTHAIANARRHGTLLAVLFMDMDRFKDINDSFGHPAGDRLLCDAAERLLATVRNQDTVVRLGGDEFLVMMEDIREPEDAAVLASKLLKAFEPAFSVAGHDLRLTLSIGISVFPRDGDDVPTLLKHADSAMYRAKEEGRNGFNFYTEQLTAAAFERLTLESALRRAVELEEFELHFQPQVALSDGRLIGAEALIRWRHPDYGLMFPDDFIPLAERIGLIIDIGEWVMRTACDQLRAWDVRGQHLPRLSLNIAVAQIQQLGFADRVARCMRDADVAPSRLELELTESFAMHKRREAIRTLAQLRELGVSIAIDDFGTGYSSLSQLKRLPITLLKVDQSFVRDIPADNNDEAITLAIIALAQQLDLEVVAEGVETEEQLAFLRHHGCCAGQGLLFGAPLPAADFAQRWLLQDPAAD